MKKIKIILLILITILFSCKEKDKERDFKYKITGNVVIRGHDAAAKFKEFIRSETGFAYGPEFHPWRSFMVITLEEQDYDVSMRNVNIRTLNG